MTDYMKFDAKLDLILNKVDGLEKRMDGIEEDISGIKFRMENELSRNIRIIAEGHLDLNRKLDEALKNSNERELFMIRLNYLEGDMKRVKEKVFTTE